MIARLAAIATAVVSLVLVVLGVALIFPPLALIVAGLGVGASLFIDVTPTRKGTP